MHAAARGDLMGAALDRVKDSGEDLREEEEMDGAACSGLMGVADI